MSWKASGSSSVHAATRKHEFVEIVIVAIFIVVRNVANRNALSLIEEQ